ATNTGATLRREVIALEAAQGGPPAEGRPAPRAVSPPRPAVPKPLVVVVVRPAPPVNGEAGEVPTEGSDEDDENALALSALEEKLKPEVLRTRTRIAKVYIEMSKVQNRRLSTLNRGQKPSAEFEKSYEKHRKKIVELVRTVHINANRIEQLKLSLYDLNR